MWPKKRIKKNFEVFNFDEKKKFIDTLLIIGSLLTALRFNIFMIPFFILFIVGSLILLSWISTLEKMSSEERQRRSTKIRNELFSAVLAFSLSSIIAVMSVQGIATTDNNNNTDWMSVGIVIGSLLAIYFMVGSFLFQVLVQYKNVEDDDDIDVVD